MRPFDHRAALRHGLITGVFCCAIAAAQTATGRGQWDVHLVYSLSIGLISWLVIELGRQWLTRRSAIPWPMGWRGFALTTAGVATGFLLGTMLGDLYSGGNIGGQRLAERTGTLPGLVTTIIATITISGFFFSRGMARHLHAQVALAQRDAAEARLKLLETQLAPHMLFNTLANLRVLIPSDPARAQQMLDHLIAYLRATLGASRSTQHPLRAEFDRLHDYLALMAVRMGPRLRYTLDLPDDLAAQPVPTLLLQPLVENAITHGLEPKIAGGTVTVQARRSDGKLVLTVTDDGVGGLATPTAPARHGTGFGLAQVRERLATAYGAHSTIELIAGRAGGTCARVTFPLKNDR